MVQDHLCETLIWGFVVTALLRFAVPAAFDPSMIADGVPPLTKWNYLPTTQLPNLFLGGLVLMARRDPTIRWVTLALAAGYAMAVGLVFSSNRPDLQFLAVTLLIWVNAVPVPRFLYIAFLAISQSSLYLYLLHGPFRSGLEILNITMPPFIALGLVIVFAVAFGQAWDRFLRAYNI